MAMIWSMVRVDFSLLSKASATRTERESFIFCGAAKAAPRRAAAAVDRARKSRRELCSFLMDHQDSRFSAIAPSVSAGTVLPTDAQPETELALVKTLSRQVLCGGDGGEFTQVAKNSIWVPGEGRCVG